MADTSYLSWPFFEDQHRNLAAELDQWCRDVLVPVVDDAGFHDDVDASCRRILKLLGDAGFTHYAVPKGWGGIHETLDVRSLCLIRMTLAYYSGLWVREQYRSSAQTKPNPDISRVLQTAVVAPLLP